MHSELLERKNQDLGCDILQRCCHINLIVNQISELHNKDLKYL